MVAPKRLVLYKPQDSCGIETVAQSAQLSAGKGSG